MIAFDLILVCCLIAFCTYLFFAAKVDILKLIEGNLKPTSGSVKKAVEKKYLTFQPRISKEYYGLRVEDYLAQQIPEGGQGVGEGGADSSVVQEVRSKEEGGREEEGAVISV